MAANDLARAAAAHTAATAALELVEHLIALRSELDAPVVDPALLEVVATLEAEARGWAEWLAEGEAPELAAA